MKNAIAAAMLLLAAAAVNAQKCAEAAREPAADIPAATLKDYEGKLAEAKARFAEAPSDADAAIWLGRRTAYLGRYKEAIRIYTAGIAAHPNDARFLRHRGHRYLTLRCFDDAIADLEKAAELVRRGPDEVEPDGLPNAKNIPTSTLHTNIYYHLGLAYYLKGDWGKAAANFMRSYNRSKNPDMQVASAHWVYMSSRRAGHRKDADNLLREIRNDLELIENDDYYTLVKMYKGLNKPDDLLKKIAGDADTLSSASLGYGIGNYLLYNGDKEKAAEIFRRITAGNQWSSFGYIAAEAELKRMGWK